MKKIILPMTLIVLGLCMLVGCLFVPTFEMPSSRSEIDFRKYVSDHTWSRKPIRPFHADRRSVEAILGPPSLISGDRRAIGYLFKVHSGVWLWPLCGGGDPVDYTTYGVRLVLNKSDQVVRVDLVRHDDVLPPLQFGTTFQSAQGAVDDLNRSGPHMYWFGDRDFWGLMSPPAGADQHPALP